MNKLIVTRFYQTNPKKRGCRKGMIKIWTEIGLFEITEQRFADETRVIRTNGWLPVEELDEIQRKRK